jgi:5-methylthioadenosine/S-adenosylhomocysteine deaminase
MTTEPRPAAEVDLVITGCTALLPGDEPDSGHAVEFAPDATVVVDGGVISDVLTGRHAVPAAREVIDGRGQLAMPGLVNCHTHSPMVLFRGAAEDVPVADWFNKWIWPMEVNLTPDDVELGARLAAAEMIRGGVTTFADHYFAMDRVAKVVAETGLRANLGWTYFSSEGDAGRERSLDFALSWRGRGGGRITTALAPHGAYTVDEADLRRTADLAADHELPVHIHASENRDQTLVSRAALGVTPIEVLRRNGILESRTIIAHGVGIVPEDGPTLSDAADRVGVASAPKGYLKSVYGTTPIRLLRAAGVPVGLATDGAASNNTLDVWESMLFTALVQKASERDSLWLTAREALDHATRQSAAVLGQAGSIGVLAPGARADVILVDLTGPHVQPVHDLAATLVYSARSSDVTTTIVDGQVLMRDRRLLTVDVADVTRRLAPRLAALTDRSHGRRIQDYTT